MQTTASILEFERDQIVAEALRDAMRAATYGREGAEVLSERLETLFDKLVDAVERGELTGMIEYAEGVAAARFAAGYDLAEVQVAMNALEEAVWRRLFAMCPPDDLGSALRLAATALGTAKDALARMYVQLVRRGPEPDVDRLFSGTA